MKHLMRYEGFSVQERQDEILDKIQQYGIASLTIDEKEFLDSFESGNEAEVHDRMKFHENDIIFEDDDGHFKFELQEVHYTEDEKHFIGIMYVPDMEFKNGSKVDGRLEGKIVLYENGSVSPEFFYNKFDKNTGDSEPIYDIFDFCGGLEYELDAFIDYVTNEIENIDF